MQFNDCRWLQWNTVTERFANNNCGRWWPVHEHKFRTWLQKAGQKKRWSRRFDWNTVQLYGLLPPHALSVIIQKISYPPYTTFSLISVSISAIFSCAGMASKSSSGQNKMKESNQVQAPNWHRVRCVKEARCRKCAMGRHVNEAPCSHVHLWRRDGTGTTEKDCHQQLSKRCYR